MTDILLPNGDLVDDPLEAFGDEVFADLDIQRGEKATVQIRPHMRNGRLVRGHVQNRLPGVLPKIHEISTESVKKAFDQIKDALDQMDAISGKPTTGTTTERLRVWLKRVRHHIPAHTFRKLTELSRKADRNQLGSQDLSDLADHFREFTARIVEHQDAIFGVLHTVRHMTGHLSADELGTKAQVAKAVHVRPYTREGHPVGGYVREGNSAQELAPGIRIVPPVPGPNVGIHSTGGFGVAEQIRDQWPDTRQEGHFGTGIYFVSTPEALSATYQEAGDRTRGRTIVGLDLTGKNLFKPTDNRQAWDLNDTLRDLHSLAFAGKPSLEIGQTTLRRTVDHRSVADKLAVILGYDKYTVRRSVVRATDRMHADAQKIENDHESWAQGGGELAANDVLRDLTYDGVDVRHIPELDNTLYGSVLFAATEQHVAKKTFDVPFVESEHPRGHGGEFANKFGKVSDYMHHLDINAHLVGGAVRDQLLGRDAKDEDFVIPHSDHAMIRRQLAGHGNMEDLVVGGSYTDGVQDPGTGQHVGVRFYPNYEGAPPDGVEVAAPRAERSTGAGRHDFAIVSSPDISLEEDAKRRDFTMNALYKNLATGEILDPLARKSSGNVVTPVTADESSRDTAISDYIDSMRQYMTDPGDAAVYTAQLNQEYDRIYGAPLKKLKKIIENSGVGVPIQIKPSIDKQTVERMGFNEKDTGDFTVTVGDSTSRTYAPDFSVWTFPDGHMETEDVLDITDRDFFPADRPDLAEAYAKVLGAVRGEKPADDKQTVTLYRAMSPAEWESWQKGDTIPVGKFFTSTETGAHAQDISGQFPTLYSAQVRKSDVVETDKGIYQLTVPATLGDDGVIASNHGDPTGMSGLADIKNKVIRTTSSDSFRDDPLRQMRALRFMSQLDFKLHPDTEKQMSEHAGAIKNISGERIQVELDKLLMGDNVGGTLRTARDTGLLQEVLPEFEKTIGLDQGSDYHDLPLDEHIIKAIENARGAAAPLEVRLALLFHDLGKPGSAWRGESTKIEPPLSSAARDNVTAAIVAKDVAKQIGGTVNVTPTSSGKLRSGEIELPGGTKVKFGLSIVKGYNSPSDPPRMVFHDFGVEPQRGGAGTKVMEALKGYSDRTGIPLTIHMVAGHAEPFYRRFPWLTETHGGLGFNYDPLVKPGSMHYYENDALGKRAHEDISAEIARDTLKRLKYPNDVTDHVVRLVKSHMMMDHQAPTPLKARKFLAKHGALAHDLIEHRRADLAAKDNPPADTLAKLDQFQQMVHDQSSAPTRIRDLAVNGDDLIGLGYQPGPGLGQALLHLLRMVIGSPELNDKTWLLTEAKRQMKRYNDTPPRGQAKGIEDILEAFDVKAEFVRPHERAGHGVEGYWRGHEEHVPVIREQDVPKWLEGAPFGKVMYHGTLAKNEQSILDSGLQDKSFGIWLTDNEKNAVSYHERTGAGKGTTIRVAVRLEKPFSIDYRGDPYTAGRSEALRAALSAAGIDPDVEDDVLAVKDAGYDGRVIIADQGTDVEVLDHRAVKVISPHAPPLRGAKAADITADIVSAFDAKSRTFVHDYTREGEQVEGYWRDILPTPGTTEPFIRRRVSEDVVKAYEVRQAVRTAEMLRDNIARTLEDQRIDFHDDPKFIAAQEGVSEIQDQAAELEKAVGGRVFRLDDSQIAKAQTRVAKLAKKALKLKLEPPTMKVVGEEYIEKQRAGVPMGEGARRHNLYIQVTGAEPKIAGWDFLATLQHLGGINVVRRVPGSGDSVSLDKYRDGKASCDHCNLSRDRNNTYIVVNNAGKVQQVGRSCLRDFLGHGDPAAIVSFLEGWQALDDLGDDSDYSDSESGTGGGRKGSIPVAAYLTHVATVLREQGWKPRSAYNEGLPTADAARENYWNWFLQEKDKRGNPMWIDPTDADRKKAQEALTWLRETLAPKEAKSEFEHNMVAMGHGENVPERGEGILAYVMVAHAKAMEREIVLAKRREKENNSDHVGTVGERMKLKLTVERVIPRDGNYGVTYITKLSDDTGNVFTWFGSYELDQGKTYEGMWAINKHDEFQGVKQTVLKRPTKLVEVESGKSIDFGENDDLDDFLVAFDGKSTVQVSGYVRDGHRVAAYERHLRFHAETGLGDAEKLVHGSKSFVENASREWDAIERHAKAFEGDADFAYLAEKYDLTYPTYPKTGDPNYLGYTYGYLAHGSRPTVDRTRTALDVLQSAWRTDQRHDWIMPALHQAAAQEFGLAAQASDRTDGVFGDERAMKALRKVMRVQYDDTQSWLKERGITKVRLYRGMAFAENPLASGFGRQEIASNPLSSWAAEYGFAYLFTSAGVTVADANPHAGAVMGTTVPAERIFSTPWTGLGDFNDNGAPEIVTLGGLDDEAFVASWHPPGIKRDLTQDDFERYAKLVASGKDVPWSEIQAATVTEGKAPSMPEGYGDYWDD